MELSNNSDRQTLVFLRIHTDSMGNELIMKYR